MNFLLQGDEAKLINLKSYFQENYLSVEKTFKEKLVNQDIVLIGAAGSIGVAILPFILNALPKNLLLIDQDENRLTTLLRLVRAKEWVSPRTNMTIAAMDFGSMEARNLLSNFSKNPVILNFAAAKHVRSERNKFGIAHLIIENFLKPWQLLEDLNPIYYFGVSTDKAANPVNFMGASKALHEKLLPLSNSSSARFANVAFSQGSLLESWNYRLKWQEPIVVPEDIERYLITHEDAARLCAISISKASNTAILIPKEGIVQSFLMHEVALTYLKNKNLRPVVLNNYQEAQKFIHSTIRANKEWPVVLTKSNTAGEKKYEEFVGKGEKIESLSTQANQIFPIKVDQTILFNIRSYLTSQQFFKDDKWQVNLTDYIKEAVPTFQPIVGSEILDSRP
jgi:FlaA1/EpsC-like NDP-sugar epimerase